MVSSFSVYLSEDDSSLKSSIYTAYQEDGSACVSSLPENLSVIIEDRGKFLLTKGAFSPAPVFYHATARSFFCGFTIQSVLERLTFFPAPDMQKIGRYLSFANEVGDTNHLTFYEGIYRLLPGEALVVENGGLSFYLPKVISTATAAPGLEQHLHDIRNYFEQSIGQKVHGRKKIAAHLSGGLDSSAVTGVAQSLRNDTLSSIYMETHTRETDELHYAEKVSKKHGTDLRKVSAGPDYLLDAVRRVIEKTGLPETSNIFSALNLAVFDACVENGADTLLSGLLGDQVVDYGSDYFDELVKKRQWRLLREVLTEHRYSGSGAEDFIIRKALKELIKRPMPLNAWHLDKELHAGIGISRKRTLTVFWKLAFKKLQIYFSKSAASDLTSRLLIAHKISPAKTLDPLQLMEGPVSGTAERMVRSIYQHIAVEAMEQTFTLYRSANISVRYPFFDKKLIETTLVSRNEWKMRNGISRATLREALKDYYPDEVYHRRSKAVFTGYLVETYRRFYMAFKAEYGERYERHPVWKICNRQVFEKLSVEIFNDAIPSGQKTKRVFIANRVLYLALWLDYMTSRTSPPGTSSGGE